MRNAPRRRTSLVIEALEERGLLSTVGLPWPDSPHLTLSFAPDGTPVGGAPSALHQSLGNSFTPDGWKARLALAFQSWAVLGNINVGIVADSGRPAGEAGPLQGDDGTGDLRVSARPLSPDVLAMATPFDLNNGWSGEVVFNSAVPFGNGGGGTQDLFASALHEAGHALGLEDQSVDPSSAMYHTVVPGRTAPSAADARALRALYGSRPPDAYEGKAGNDTAAKATPLAYLATPGDLVPRDEKPGKDPARVAEADLTRVGDVDVYSFKVPAGAAGTFDVSVRAAGLSLVTTRLTVLDALGQVVGSAVTIDPLRNDLTVAVANAPAGSRFTARVEASQPGAFAIGAYRIAAGRPELARAAAAPGASDEAILPDNGRNDNFSKATKLKAREDADTGGWAHAVRAEVSGASDVDFYEVKTDRDTPSVMLLTVWAREANGITPRLDVFDKQQRPVAARLYRRDAFSYTLQIPDVGPNETYAVRVSALDPSGPRAAGRYFLGVDYLAQRLADVPFAAGALDASDTQDFRTLTVSKSQVFHFQLSADAGAPAGGTGVAVAIYDSRNRPVFTLRAVAGGAAVGGDVLLGPGTYTVRVRGANRNGSPLPLTLYKLVGQVRSDPIGPQEVDPTLIPPMSGPTTPPDDPYDWSDYEEFYYGYFLTLLDIESSPWLE